MAICSSGLGIVCQVSNIQQAYSSGVHRKFEEEIGDQCKLVISDAAFALFVI